MDDPHDLQRFVDAQRGVYDTALAEIVAGRKQSHWMWFVFPQIAGLGGSSMSRRHAIRSRDEAAAYLAHPTLGARLVRCAEAAIAARGSARTVFGTPDDLKLRSSATLFAEVAAPESVFRRVLARYFDGKPDEATLRELARSDGA